MTKAATEGAKRRRRARAAQSALQAACPISGVRITAARDCRVGPSEGATEAMLRALDRICRGMGWPEDDAHRAKARDQRVGTLFGRLFLGKRISERACRGFESWERLRLDYRREVLGAATPLTRERVGCMDPEERAEYLERLKAQHADAEGVKDTWRPVVRFLALYVMDPPEWRAPDTFSEAQCEAIDACGLQLADLFGLDE